MGCTNYRRKQEPEVVINTADQNGYRHLFYSKNQFDLSRSESENEEQEIENYSFDSVKNPKEHVTKKIISPSNELTSTNNTSSTTVNNLVNNENSQTGV